MNINNNHRASLGRGDYFRFGSVFIKKSNQTEIFFLKKKPETDRFWFGSVFLGKNRFKPVWLGFLGLARFFPVLARFFRFGSVFPVWLSFGSVLLSFFFGFLSVSVRFGFLLIKPNRTGRFFQKFNRFFFRFGFFGYFFSGLIGFPVFLLTPTPRQ